MRKATEPNASTLETALFFFDFNSKSGLGHAIRTMRIAKRLKSQGWLTHFALTQREKKGSSVLDELGISAKEIVWISPPPPSSQRDDFVVSWVRSELLNPALRLNASLIFIDSYSVSEVWLREFRLCGLRSAVIDDLGGNLSPDFLIDYGVNAVVERSLHRSGVTKLLLGPMFTPVDACHEGATQPLGPKRVLISLGGGRYEELYRGLTLAHCATESSATLTFATPTGFELPQRADMGRIRVIQGSQGLQSLMCDFDLVVTSAGVSLMERLSAGKNGIAVITAQNQAPNVEKLREQLDLNVVSLDSLRNPVGFCREIEESLSQSWGASQRLPMQAIFDGHGADRVTYEISGRPLEELRLQEATERDLPILFRWANDSLAMSASRRKSKITAKEHLDWFNSAPERKESIFVAFKANVPVGTVRLHATDRGVRLSYLVDPFYQGAGVGKALVYQAIIASPRNQEIFAEVAEENLPSIRLLKSLGFEIATSETEFLRFVLRR